MDVAVAVLRRAAFRGTRLHDDDLKLAEIQGHSASSRGEVASPRGEVSGRGGFQRLPVLRPPAGPLPLTPRASWSGGAGGAGDAELARAMELILYGFRGGHAVWEAARQASAARAERARRQEYAEATIRVQAIQRGVSTRRRYCVTNKRGMLQMAISDTHEAATRLQVRRRRRPPLHAVPSAYTVL